jgi:hypothetical protein
MRSLSIGSQMEARVHLHQIALKEFSDSPVRGGTSGSVPLMFLIDWPA